MQTLPFSADTPWLAPLAGYSDLPFRILCRENGAACCTTEMVSAKGLFYKSPGTWPLLQTVAGDAPLIVQLFGSEACYLKYAVVELRKKGFEYFDLNIGCSVPKVMRQGAGAGMLRDPENILVCAKAMLDEAGLGKVGFKLRTGIDSGHSVIPDLPLRLQELGAGWITLHPRFANQSFRGEADWSLLKSLAEKLSIPLVGSGDLLTAALGVRCIQETGVATVMYARGALAKPSIFLDHKRLVRGEPVYEMTSGELKALLLRHLRLAREWTRGKNPEKRIRGLLAAHVHSLPNAKNLRADLCRDDAEAIETILDRWIP
ncbi:MAG: tRNA-dihydrouridine synthase family protein [Desulfovibrionaceae bacterium]|nr:tRNA-dihydrouridine synthase family protein [Desulfovibrionaceae bacterium]